jgi:hypothetical protein
MAFLAGPDRGPAMRSISRLCGAAVVVTLALAIVLPAAAHNELVGSTPADGATLETPPSAVVLEFEQPVRAEFAAIVVLDEDDSAHQQGAPVVDGPTVTQAVNELAPGAYRVSYRIGSADGHPITGMLTFTVVGAAALPGRSDETTMAVSENGGGTGAIMLIAGGVAVVTVFGAAFYVVMGRRQTRRRRDGDMPETGR